MFPRFGRRVALAAAAILFSQLPSGAYAQNFERPVRIIVPFAPGGTSDILARLISPKLSAAIGQAWWSRTSPAHPAISAPTPSPRRRLTATTLLLTDVGSLATAPSLFSNLTYNLEKDLAPVTMVMFGPYVLAVHESSPGQDGGGTDRLCQGQSRQARRRQFRRRRRQSHHRRA